MLSSMQLGLIDKSQQARLRDRSTPSHVQALACPSPLHLCTTKTSMKEAIIQVPFTSSRLFQIELPESLNNESLLLLLRRRRCHLSWRLVHPMVSVHLIPQWHSQISPTDGLTQLVWGHTRSPQLPPSARPRLLHLHRTFPQIHLDLHVQAMVHFQKATLALLPVLELV